MSYTPYYPNGWQSGKTGGTPITPAALQHIEKGIENSAPSGYGLGDISWKTGAFTRFDDASKLDDLKVNSFWCYQKAYAPLITESPDTQFVNGITIASNSGFVTQIGCTLYSGYWIERRFVTSGGVGAWSRWKFINPPLLTGVMYPTTEFFRNLTKYVGVVSLGIGTAGGTVELEHGIAGLGYPISCDVLDFTGTKFEDVKFTPSSISFRVPTDYGKGNIYALISYTLSE